MSNVHFFPDSRRVHTPGVLSEREEMRAVPMSRRQAEEIEDLAVRLASLGAMAMGMLLMEVVSAWKASQ